MLLDVTDKSEKPWDDIFLLLVIKSSPEGFERRQVLRQTWAEERNYRGKPIRREEGRTYGDLLQWDFTDSFYNLTLKQLLFLDWFQTRCRRCHFLMNGETTTSSPTPTNTVEFLLSRHGNDGDQPLF
uniref:Hexosyltransferase n=1 Tax=Knipowitschia caucasica TaxID=637954 RepID=A0AAV2JF32_KNICA